MKEDRHKKPHIVWFHFHEMSLLDKSIQPESKLVVARRWRGEETREWLFNGYGVSFEGDENVLESSKGNAYTTLRIY